MIGPSGPTGIDDPHTKTADAICVHVWCVEVTNVVVGTVRIGSSLEITYTKI